MATWADVLQGGLTSILDGARDVLVAKEETRRTEQYPPYPYGGGVYGPYANGYQYGPQGPGGDPWNTQGYPQAGGFFGLSQNMVMALLVGGAVVAVVLAVGD